MIKIKRKIERLKQMGCYSMAESIEKAINKPSPKCRDCGRIHEKCTVCGKYHCRFLDDGKITVSNTNKPNTFKKYSFCQNYGFIGKIKFIFVVIFFILISPLIVFVKLLEKLDKLD